MDNMAWIAVPLQCGFGLIWLLMMAVLIAGIILWIFMLIDLIKRPSEAFNSENEKLLWVFVLLFGSYIGAIIYYFLVYKKQSK